MEHHLREVTDAVATPQTGADRTAPPAGAGDAPDGTDCAVHQRAASPLSRREVRTVYWALMIVVGLGTLDQSIVATALPRVMSELGGIAHSSWIVTAYVLASTASMPLYGKLSDQYGRKPMVCIALVTFLIGSLMCGWSGNLTELIVSRIVQGLGAGAFLPLSQTIIADLIPPAQRGSRQGGIAAVYAATSVMGPLLGGAITDALSWHWIFFLNLPLGGVALYAIVKTLRPAPPRGSQTIDYWGSLLMATAVTLFLLVLSLGGSTWPWNSSLVWSLSASAAFLTMLLVLHLRRTAAPVLPPSLFHNKVFNIASIVMSLTFMGLFGASIFLPLYAQMANGAGATESGLLLVPLMLGAVMASVLSGRILQRSGRYKPTQLVGLALAFAAFALVAWGIGTGRSYWCIEPCVFMLGIGLGLVMPNMTVAVQNALPPDQRGVGTAMLTFFRSLGGLIGVAGSSAIIARQLEAAAVLHASVVGHDLVGVVRQTMGAEAAIYRSAIAETFAIGSVFMAIAFMVLLLLPEIALEEHAEGKPAPRRA